MKLLKEDVEYLASLKCFSEGYIDWLKRYRYDATEIDFHQGGKGELVLEISGRWSRTVLWQVPLLTVISETYAQTDGAGKGSRKEEDYKRSVEKAKRLADGKCHFADFGTRSRRNAKTHETLIRAFAETAKKDETIADYFEGTSNLHFARQFDLKPFDTVSHEWVMAYAGLGGIRWANHRACRNWIEFYKERLDMAVADTYTTKRFFEEFDAELSHLYSGVRYDGDDGCAFTDEVVKHYNSFRIDPSKKTIVHSGGLDLDTALKIERHTDSQIKTCYGFDSYFTNDVPDAPPLVGLVKLTHINGRSVYQDS